MSALIPSAIFLLVAGFITKNLYLKQPPALQKYFVPGLLFKLIAGILVGVLYFFYYKDGDTLTIWRDANVIAFVLKGDVKLGLMFLFDQPSHMVPDLLNHAPRTIFLVKIMSLFSLIFNGNYWLMSVAISWVSFLGAWYLVVKVSTAFKASAMAAFWAFLAFPSVVFWSSGIIKESLGLASLFFLSGVLVSFCKGYKIKIWEWAGVVLAIWLGWNLKYYWIGVFLPIAITTAVITLWVRLRPAMKSYEMMLWAGVLVMFVLVATASHPNFYPGRFLEVIMENNRDFMRLSGENEAIHFYDLQPGWSSVVMNAPWAALSAMFRPFIWETYGLLSFAASVENLVVLFLVVTSLISVRKLATAEYRLLSLAVVVYVLILAVFLALSTPNLGTLSRYKVGFLPFLIFLVLYQNKFASVSYLKSLVGSFRKSA